ncbi:hypothetical protein MHU86_12986 [Fragilaria crotonensis]|nr:hypothetical protein MHU86_12986 [Fragilaria crotonensis]
MCLRPLRAMVVAVAICVLLLPGGYAQSNTRNPSANPASQQSPITDQPVGPPIAPVPDTPEPTVQPIPISPLSIPPFVIPTLTSQAPVTVPPSAAPVSAMPVSEPPFSASPVTPDPTSGAPVSPEPTSGAPVSPEPTSGAPVTPEPTSGAPVTEPPTTAAPTTEPPTTEPPTTELPTTGSPTIAPSVLPVTDQPTKKPTTEKPTTEKPTGSRTDEPSNSEPTKSPTPAPSRAPRPTTPAEPLNGVTMVLVGITALNADSIAAWEKTTTEYIESFYDDVSNARDVGASNVVTTISLTNQATVTRRLLWGRSLQSSGGQVQLTYNQELSFTAQNDKVTSADVAAGPFDTSSRRTEYVVTLRNSGDEGLSKVVSAEEVVVPETKSTSSSGLSTGAIAGIAVGGAIVLMLLMWAISKWVLYRSNKLSGYIGDVEDAPPTSIKTGPDDVSTMDGYSKVRSSRESLAGYGDQSVATVDYDYSKAYGGGADHSVSSAGGTFGSNPNAFGANQGVLAAGAYPDDGSYEAPDANVREAH